LSNPVSSSTSARGVAQLLGSQHFAQLVDQFGRKGREIVDEVERVLDLVRDARGKLAKRGHLLRLDKVGLRCLQFAERGLDRAAGFLRGTARGADRGLVSFPFCYVSVDQHKPA
jgi:hypothetical protein